MWSAGTRQPGSGAASFEDEHRRNHVLNEQAYWPWLPKPPLRTCSRATRSAGGCGYGRGSCGRVSVRDSGQFLLMTEVLQPMCEEWFTRLISRMSSGSCWSRCWGVAAAVARRLG